jgi:hypothetical protein
MSSKSRLKCEECNWIGEQKKVLVSPNPFNKDESICGCPVCFEVGTMRRVCDDSECKDKATCGTSTSSGYWWTCGKHRPGM